MDFEKELRNFARSDLPLRQMREDAHLEVRIVTDTDAFDGRLCDLSRGGVGAAVIGGKPENFVIDRAVVLHVCWPDEKENANSEIPVRVAWVKVEEDEVLVGFAFDTLSEELEIQIDRFLLNRIILRNLESDDG